VALVMYRGTIRERWPLLFTSFRFMPVTAFWKKSFRYFPNHHFQWLLWNMLTHAEEGQQATLLVFEPQRKEGKTLSIAIHEVLAQKGDKFQAFQCIREQVRDIFHSAHGNKDLLGNDSVYYALPKVMLHSEVLQTEEVQSIIQELKANGDGSAARRAEAYFKEIVSDRHYTIAKVVNWMVSQLFKRCFVNLELRGVEHIKELNRNYQVVYLPSHRSHLDFLTMSHLTYESGLEAPYIAASNHLNFFPVRYIQMVSGYFIRRKKMEPLYNAILYQYIRAMQRYGKSHMVFVEGTRSKTGEVLQPKAGIVSQYLNAYIEEQKRPLVFIPMNITYDFVLEGESYLEHIHEFMKKGNEWDAEHAKAYEQHLSDRKNQGRWAKLKKLLQAFRNMKPQGSAYLTPGEPIFLSQVLEEHRPDWADLPVLRQEAIPDAWIRDIARLIVRKACTEINQPTVPRSRLQSKLWRKPCPRFLTSINAGAAVSAERPKPHRRFENYGKAIVVRFRKSSLPPSTAWARLIVATI
ncbi:MAG: 1-acyl-sn-glycerol-3-phosphate acyltransferase, partial [Pseudobdellovibrionaceae bacterium]|nr:1-acyl-sn-glycerol-3-phosphate acyltransferase [Pseudobdellovibrionaceae bacterium]